MDTLDTVIAWADLHLGFLVLVATVLGVLVGLLTASMLGRMVRALDRFAEASGRQTAALSENMTRERQPNLILVSKGDRLELVNFGSYPAYIEGVEREVKGGSARMAVLYVSVIGSDKEIVSKVLPPASSARLGGLSTDAIDGRITLDIPFRYGGTGDRQHHLVAEVVSHPDRGFTVSKQGLKED